MSEEYRSDTEEERALMKKLSSLPELIPAPGYSEQIRQASLAELRAQNVYFLKEGKKRRFPPWLQIPDFVPTAGAVIGAIYIFWVIEKSLLIYGF